MIRAICRDLLERFGGRCPTTSTRCSPSRASGGRPRTSWSPSGSPSPASASTFTSTASRTAWGSCGPSTPDQTELALRAKLPRRYWIGYNDLLVAFGQNVCRPLSPALLPCPVAPLVSPGRGRAGPLSRADSARWAPGGLGGPRRPAGPPAARAGGGTLAGRAGSASLAERAARPPASPPRARPRPSPRLVLAVHYPWYGTPGGPTRPLAPLEPRAPRDARGAASSASTIPVARPGPGGSTSARPTIPRAGPYDSRDPARIRAQLALAREAGLDGFRCPGGGVRARRRSAWPRSSAHAREAGLVLAPYYETGELWRAAPRRGGRTSRSLLDRHGTEPAWLRVGGVPVVFLYASHRLRPRAWDAVRARLAGGGPAALPGGRRAEPRVAGRAARLAPALRRPPRLHAGRVPGPGPGRGCVYRASAALARGAGRPFVPAVGARVRRPPGPDAGHRGRSRRGRDLRRDVAGGPRVDPPGSSCRAGTSGTRAARSSRAWSTGAGTSTRPAAGPSASGRARPDGQSSSATPGRVASAHSAAAGPLGARALPVEGIERPGSSHPS